ncbi:MAG TPA: CNNM domain-containing protein [Candidatus Omnitrophota bacterium]|nr:CNNM domain-containing protein [Candidatus Omnitrophota bacterium]
MIGLLTLFGLSLVASAFFSGAEMAFVSANKLRLREMADAGDKKAKFIMRLQQHPNYFLTAILIGNNIVNVTAISIATYILKEYFGWNTEWGVMLLLAPILIIFGEMVPKDYCRLTAIPFLMGNTLWIRLLTAILYGPIVLFFKLLNFILPSLRQASTRDIFVNEEEFRSLIDESTQRGIVGPQEEKLIHTILDFERIQVQSVMLPVSQVPMVDIHSKIEDVKKIAREKHARMMLVYEEIPSIVMGMIYVFDILWEEEDAQGLHDFLRAPVFIPDETSLEKAFLTLQKKRQSYAIVTDRTGDIKGVVPIERLLIFEKH